MQVLVQVQLQPANSGSSVNRTDLALGGPMIRKMQKIEGKRDGPSLLFEASPGKVPKKAYAFLTPCQLPHAPLHQHPAASRTLAV